MLLFVGATFFSFTLYSGEIIAALVRSNLISVNLEKISDDVGSKNQRMIANQQLEAVTSKLENAEKLLLDSNQELSKLEMTKNGLKTETEKLKQSIEKLKFELVDQQNKKKLAENKKGKTKGELELLKNENEQLKETHEAEDSREASKTIDEEVITPPEIEKSNKSEYHSDEEDLQDQLLRVMADNENLRKRTDREIQAAKKYGSLSAGQKTKINLCKALLNKPPVLPLKSMTNPFVFGFFNI